MGKDNWISVEDRLPESYKDVLVWAIYWTEVPIQAYYSNDDKKWYGSREVVDCMKDGYCNNRELQFIPTHYMPLPSPPKTKGI